MSFVLDDSVTMRWFFEDGSPQDLAYADTILAAIKDQGAIVPVTWGLEVSNVLSRAEAKSVVKAVRTDAFLEMLEGLNIKPDAATFENSFTGTLHLARKYKLSSYDASYLELAIRLNIPLATLDEDLQKAAKKAGVKKFA